MLGPATDIHFLETARSFSVGRFGAQLAFLCPFVDSPRPTPDLRGAARDDDASAVIPRLIGARRLPHDLREATAERPKARRPNRSARIRHTHIAPAQQRLRAFDAPRHEVRVRGLAVGLPEAAAEMGGRHVGRLRHGRDIERPRVLAVDEVPSAAEVTQLVEVGRGHVSSMRGRLAQNAARRRIPRSVDANQPVGPSPARTVSRWIEA